MTETTIWTTANYWVKHIPKRGRVPRFTEVAEDIPVSVKLIDAFEGPDAANFKRLTFGARLKDAVRHGHDGKLWRKLFAPEGGDWNAMPLQAFEAAVRTPKMFEWIDNPFDRRGADRKKRPLSREEFEGKTREIIEERRDAAIARVTRAAQRLVICNGRVWTLAKEPMWRVTLKEASTEMALVDGIASGPGGSSAYFRADELDAAMAFAEAHHSGKDPIGKPEGTITAMDPAFLAADSTTATLFAALRDLRSTLANTRHPLADDLLSQADDAYFALAGSRPNAVEHARDLVEDAMSINIDTIGCTGVIQYNLRAAVALLGMKAKPSVPSPHGMLDIMDAADDEALGNFAL